MELSRQGHGVVCHFLLHRIPTGNWTHVSWVSYIGTWILYLQCHLGSPHVLISVHIFSNIIFTIRCCCKDIVSLWKRTPRLLSEYMVWDWKWRILNIAEFALVGCGVDLEPGFPALTGYRINLQSWQKFRDLSATPNLWEQNVLVYKHRAEGFCKQLIHRKTGKRNRRSSFPVSNIILIFKTALDRGCLHYSEFLANVRA